jgi:HSP20 family protein
MITACADPFDALLNLQRSLEARLASDWLEQQTTSRGPFPPINVFQQGSDLLAIIELPGIDKDSLQIRAQENTIRARLSAFQQDQSGKMGAELKEGVLSLTLPKVEEAKPRTIQVN